MTTTLLPGVLSFLHDVARSLVLADQGLLRVRANGRWYSGTMARMQEITETIEDWQVARGEQPARQFWLLQLLLDADLLQIQGDLAHSTSKAERWLQMDQRSQIELLRATWQGDPASAWRWMRPHRGRGWADHYWRSVVQRVMDSVQRLPSGGWADLSELVTSATEIGLAELDAYTQMRLPQVREGMRTRTHRLVHFLTAGVLDALGLVEISNQEGILHVRLAAREDSCRADRSSCGQGRIAALQSIEGLEPLAVGPVVEEDHTPAKLLVGDDLTVMVPLDAPLCCTFELLHMARLVTLGPPAIYRIDEASLQKATSHGYAPVAAQRLLKSYGRQPLPAVAVSWLEARQQELKIIRCEPGYRLHLTDGIILDELLGHRRFRASLERGPSGRIAWVDRDVLPTVLRSLRRRGFTVQPQEHQAQWASWPSQRALFPTIPLLVMLATYRLVQGIVPALAALEMNELEACLALGLSVTERNAIQRLVNSHRALLAAHLRPLSGTALVSDDTDPALPTDHEAEIMALLRQGMARDQEFILVYVDAHGAPTRRVIQPLRIESRGSRRYLWAQAGPGQPERCFRVDRIISLTLTQ